MTKSLTKRYRVPVRIETGNTYEIKFVWVRGRDKADARERAERRAMTMWEGGKRYTAFETGQYQITEEAD